jgi:hypothetical protein
LNGGFKPTMKRIADLGGPDFFPTPRWATFALIDNEAFKVAANPTMGDLMSGTGGCRKCRFPGRGKGKSGGYRTIHYNGADDVPVLLLALLDKGERDNLSQAERNQLKKALQTYEEEYRAGVAAKVAETVRR